MSSIGNPFGPTPGPDAVTGQDTGEGAAGVRGINVDPGGIGVKGFGGNGAFGFLGGNDPQFHQHAGVYGESGQQGVIGHSFSNTGTGVFGNGVGGSFGVRGESAGGIAVQGQSFGNGARGFLGGNDPQFGQHAGVYGESDQQGVMGLTTSDAGTGVYGGGASKAGASGAGGIGVRGETFSGVGVQGQSFGDGLAGKFIGNVQVTGNITAQDVVLAGGDCAEDFDISGAEKIEPGMVMVIDQEGALQQSQQAYDKRVAGVISGAGDLRPGIILDKQQSQSNRMPIALLGKVYCKVDAQYSSIEVGDLLTTSPTPGHAMKADDPLRAFGAVIGKALRPLQAGQGLLPILIALQ